MKITALETAELGPDSPMPRLVFVRVHTDDGLVGLGETYYLPSACREVIHRDIAASLLGKDARDIERHWRYFADFYGRVAARGAEMRALSAVDVALWDIAGQAAGMPIHQLLGGRCTDRLPIYNSCGGPNTASGRAPQRPGELSDEARRTSERYDDLTASFEQPEALARDLLAEGIDGMKFAPFDRFAARHRGLRIDPADLHEGLETVRRIREAVGDRMQIMIEGHGLWSLEPALDIARALEAYNVAWVEDLVRATDVELVAQLRAGTRAPVCASEFLVGRTEYRRLLLADGADIVMVDSTWAGGITEARKIAVLADTFGVPVTFHDCTGPVTLMADVHLGFASPNTLVQETCRAYIRTFYGDFVDGLPELDGGAILPPTAPGLGMTLRPELFEDPTVTWTRTEL